MDFLIPWSSWQSDLSICPFDFFFLLKSVFSFCQGNAFVGFKESTSSKSHIMKNSSQPLLTDFSLQRKSMLTPDYFMWYLLSYLSIYLYYFFCSPTFIFKIFKAPEALKKTMPFTEIHQLFTFYHICFIPSSLLTELLGYKLHILWHFSTKYLSTYSLK